MLDPFLPGQAWSFYWISFDATNPIKILYTRGKPRRGFSNSTQLTSKKHDINRKLSRAVYNSVDIKNGGEKMFLNDDILSLYEENTAFIVEDIDDREHSVQQEEIKKEDYFRRFVALIVKN